MPLFKKKFKDTAVAKFLKEKAPHIIEAVGKRFPAIGLITDLINKDEKLTPEEKATALEMAKIELQNETEITNRWKFDSESDSWLSKNARPLVLLSSVVMLYIFIILDSCKIKFEIKESWISLYEVILVTAIGGYFGMRSWEKIKAKK